MMYNIISIGEDLVLKNILDFLDCDMIDNPQNIYALDKNKVEEVQSLVSEVKIDFNSPLSDRDE